MIKSIKSFLQSGEPIKLSIDTKDELHELATSVANLSKMVPTSK